MVSSHCFTPLYIVNTSIVTIFIFSYGCGTNCLARYLSTIDVVELIAD